MSKEIVFVEFSSSELRLTLVTLVEKIFSISLADSVCRVIQIKNIIIILPVRLFIFLASLHYLAVFVI